MFILLESERTHAKSGKAPPGFAAWKILAKRSPKLCTKTTASPTEAGNIIAARDWPFLTSAARSADLGNCQSETLETDEPRRCDARGTVPFVIFPPVPHMRNQRQ
jgi:hypothetical protein